ncbi:MAG: DinB family protein [Thermoanaerobaculales bacterium]
MTKRNLGVFLLLLGASVSLVSVAMAAGPMPTGLKGEMLMNISGAEDKLNQLAAAIPEDKYSWRPGEGVRSPAEVFMHVAGANYGIPSFWGVKPPAGFDFKTYEKSLTKKADIQKALEASFAYMKAALEAASDEDLAKPVEFFGFKTTVRGGYLLVLSHAHEHLGQMIAYARMNGVVPPWTAKEQAAEQAEMKTKAKS